MAIKNEKKCSNCFKVKPVTEFYRKVYRWQARCKACNAEVCRAYRHRRQKRLRDIKEMEWLDARLDAQCEYGDMIDVEERNSL